MPVRERLHDRLDMVIVLDPVSPDLVAALPSALTTLLTSPEGAALRRRPTAGGRWKHHRRGNTASLRAAAEAAFTQHPDGVAPPDLALAAHSDGYQNLPVAIHRSGRALAVMIPHDLFDGSGGWEHFERLFQIASDLEPVDLRPALRFPLFTSMRRAELLSRGAIDEVRGVRHGAETSTETAPLLDHDVFPDDVRRSNALRTVWLPKARLAAISAAKGTGGKHDNLSTRLNALVIDTVREVVPADKDMRVRMAIDLRRYLPKKHRVEGPFSTSFPVGTLRTMDTSPRALGEAARAAIATKAPLAGFVADTVGWVKGRVRYPRGFPAQEPGRRSFDLVVSMLPARLPLGFWDTDGEKLIAALLYHPVQPTDPYVQMALVEGGLVVALYDEAGVIDRDRFAAAFTALLDERYPG